MVIARLLPSVDRSEEYVQQFRDNNPHQGVCGRGQSEDAFSSFLMHASTSFQVSSGKLNM